MPEPVRLSELCKCLNITELDAKVFIEFVNKYVEVTVHVPEDIDPTTTDILVLAATFRHQPVLRLLEEFQRLLLFREVCRQVHWPATITDATTILLINPFDPLTIHATWSGAESWLDLNTGRAAELVPAGEILLSWRMLPAVRQTWSKCPHLAR